MLAELLAKIESLLINLAWMFRLEGLQFVYLDSLG